jgi:hypothetical protein
MLPNRFKITVTDHFLLAHDATATEAAKLAMPTVIFEQSVETLDLPKLFAAVNSKPRKPRAPKPAKTAP